MVVGGRRVGSVGYFVEPTLITDVRPEMVCQREEIFGPVLTVVPFDSVEEVIAAANDSPYGLAAAVWTKDISKAHKTAAALVAGTVWSTRITPTTRRSRGVGTSSRAGAASSASRGSATTC